MASPIGDHNPWSLEIVEGMVHWYNLLTIMVPSLLRFVIGPLESAQHNATLFLPAGVQMEALAHVFPKARLLFDESVPRSADGDGSGMKMYVPGDAGELGKTSTLLIVPEVFPLGFRANGGDCARLMIKQVRARFVHDWIVKGSPTQISFVERGDVDGYTYERPNLAIVPNMQELSERLAPWAADRGYEYQRVVLESMPFRQQLEVAQRTRILIGVEGAGLAHMLFMAQPARSAVIELNWENGKVGISEEFPTLAERVGVPLWMHIYRCAWSTGGPCDPELLVQNLQAAHERVSNISVRAVS